jgi:hypothetical protein
MKREKYTDLTQSPSSLLSLPPSSLLSLSLSPPSFPVSPLMSSSVKRRNVGASDEEEDNATSSSLVCGGRVPRAVPFIIGNESVVYKEDGLTGERGRDWRNPLFSLSSES